MTKTAISWTQGDDGSPGKTWNPVRGCSRVSAGCKNCYAERQALRFAGPGQPYEGLVTKRLKVINADEHDKGNYVEAHWTGKVMFLPGMLSDPLRWKKPCRVFVNSMADLFHEELGNEQIAAVFGVMAAAKQHTFQILTKRSRRMREWFRWLEGEAASCNGMVGMSRAARCFVAAQREDPYFNLDGTPTIMRRADVVDAGLNAPWPLPNVWLGVSTENQDAADDRIPELLSTPAAIRFISAEPLIGPIDLEHVQHNGEFEVDALAGTHGVTRPHAGRGVKLDWVIAGAESGPRSRPCDYRWLRSLRNQCARASVAFFLKQAANAYENGDGFDSGPRYKTRAPNWVVTGGEGSKQKSGGIFERPYLDGVQHLEFPR